MSGIRLGHVLRAAFVWGATVAAPSIAFAQAGAQERGTFDAFLERVTQAHAEYIRGRPEPFTALWSRAPDVTIFGGFGSGEHGWDQGGSTTGLGKHSIFRWLTRDRTHCVSC